MMPISSRSLHADSNSRHKRDDSGANQRGSSCECLVAEFGFVRVCGVSALAVSADLLALRARHVVRIEVAAPGKLVRCVRAADDSA
jgi:hypothetical protein